MVEITRPIISHDENQCGKCTFVANPESIVVTSAQRESATWTRKEVFKMLVRKLLWEDKVVSLGNFTMPGWAGHAVWYLFQCLECHELSIDYVHGYPYKLICKHCSVRIFLARQLPGQELPELTQPKVRVH